MIEDAELLRRYADDKSEGAFTELVHRRIDLVYAVALRQVGGDSHLAQDVTQRVFVDLARKAPGLKGRAVITGWLYRSAQFAASDTVRAERRRRAREQETEAMQESIVPENATEWDKVRPMLDEALGELNDQDRDAVALRFFEGRAFADIGRRLQLTEDGARKRVERALDKVAAALARRGITSTGAAVGIALGSQAVLAAPAGLAASVTSAALAGAGAVGWVAATVSFLASVKMTMLAGAVAAGAIGVAVQQTRRVADLEQAGAGQVQARQTAEAEVRTLRHAFADAEQRRAAAEQDNAALLTAIQSQSAARTAAGQAARPPAEPITRDQMEARWRRAQELAKSGDPGEALAELLWCFDEGMARVGGYSGVRRSFLLSTIAKLGEKHPEALDALRKRRDAAERRLLVSENDYDAAADFGAINRVIKDAARTLSVLERFEPGDRRRRTLASNVIDELVEQRRYPEAMEARTFDQMVQFFGSLQQGAQSEERRKSTVNYVAKYVQILAGAGQTAQAREFAQKVLAFDATAGTRALLQAQAARAGHPRLLDEPPVK